MENVLIVAKTRAYEGNCTSGIVLCSNQSLRLLTKLGTHQPYDSPFEIGQIWELSWKRKYHSQPSHVEDVRVLEQRFISVQDSLRAILLQRVQGSPEQLFNGYIVLIGTSERTG